ncbi:MAG: prepilin-type N-terminal cleavage/methylation domain-containing protein [Lysobacterales bacterium]|jgi:prepilin-type N-terminal cleavage/methylation domain-containing protein
MTRGNRGFTLVELMITLVIVAIGLALAIPSWSSLVEKREVTAAAEQMVSFIEYARSEAVKRNQPTNLSWFADGHKDTWCIGVNAGNTVCDCTQTTTTAADFCQIDGQAQRLVQTDFVDIGYKLVHTQNALDTEAPSVSFDPIRGILAVDDLPAGLNTELMTMLTSTVTDNYMFKLHSNDQHNSKRLYEVQIWLNLLGQVSICAESSGRRGIIGGYPLCP